MGPSASLGKFAGCSDEDENYVAPRLPGHRLDEVTIDATTYALQHDAAGRLTTGLVFDFEYDPHGRLYRAESPTGAAEDYLYDADGRLAHVSTTDGVTTTSQCFAYDGDHMIGAYDPTDSSIIWEAVWGPGQDQLLEYFDGSGWHHVLRDHRNNPVATWDAENERVSGSAWFTAEGLASVTDHAALTVECDETAAVGQVCLGLGGMPFGFNSAWKSSLTGQSFMRNRWYSPRLGQFTTHDPLGFAAGHDLYGFAAFDPINRWDPWGLATSEFAPFLVQRSLLSTLRNLFPGVPLKDRELNDQEEEEVENARPGTRTDQFRAVQPETEKDPPGPLDKALTKLARRSAPVLITEDPKVRWEADPPPPDPFAPDDQPEGEAPAEGRRIEEFLLYRWSLGLWVPSRELATSVDKQGVSTTSDRLSTIHLQPGRGDRAATLAHELLVHHGLAAAGWNSNHEALPDKLFTAVEVVARSPILETVMWRYLVVLQVEDR